jgi:hypothetical protein
MGYTEQEEAFEMISELMLKGADMLPSQVE